MIVHNQIQIMPLYSFRHRYRSLLGDSGDPYFTLASEWKDFCTCARQKIKFILRQSAHEVNSAFGFCSCEYTAQTTTAAPISMSLSSAFLFDLVLPYKTIIKTLINSDREQGMSAVHSLHTGLVTRYLSAQS